MNIEILCTGDEILTGKTVNTNYSHMAQRLGESGLDVVWGTTVGDDRERLTQAFVQAAGRADAVIVNGGLGPTVDDLSQEIAAAVAGVGLELHEAWLERMLAWYRRRGREMPPNNRKQALLPAGAEFIDNPIGTACGFALDIGKARFFFTPGVPREMRRMLDEQVIPRLLELSGLAVVTQLKRFHTFGIGESRADQLLAGVEAWAPDGSVKLGFQAHYPQLETKLVGRAATAQELQAKLAPVAAEVRRRLGNFVVAEDAQTLPGAIVERLRKRGDTLATLEMYTAGSIAARLLPVAGSERVFRRGIVSRNLGELSAAAGVEPALATVGEDGARALADGLRRVSDATLALAVLIEPNDGADGTDDIEFGADVHIAIAAAAASVTVTRRARLIGGREWVRLGAVELGLDCLRRYLYGLPVAEKIDFEQQ